MGRNEDEWTGTVQIRKVECLTECEAQPQYGAAFTKLICISRSVSHTSESEHMFLIIFLGIQATGILFNNSVGTDFFACKTGMDRMNVTMQYLSLWHEWLFQLGERERKKRQQSFVEMLVLRLYP